MNLGWISIDGNKGRWNQQESTWQEGDPLYVISHYNPYKDRWELSLPYDTLERAMFDAQRIIGNKKILKFDQVETIRVIRVRDPIIPF